MSQFHDYDDGYDSAASFEAAGADRPEGMDSKPRATPYQIARARRLYAQGSDDDIEIDDDALVSEGDGGAWVQAWVWVPNQEVSA